MYKGFSVTFDHHPDAVENDAGHAVVDYEDERVATLIHDGFNWSLVLINPNYGELGGEIDDEYPTVDDFINALTNELEKV